MLASEENCKTEIAEALSVVETAFSENPEFVELLGSPAVSLEERCKVIENTFAALPGYVISFLKILCERRYLPEFPEMIKIYRELMEVASKVSVAKVTSAVELTAEERSALTGKLETMWGNTIVLETAVDKEILGGIVIEIDGKVIDASLRQRLSDVKDVISR